MEELHILIIEDEKVQIDLYCDVIEQFNKSSEYKIVPEFQEDYARGEEALNTPYYDAAIIDLKLSNTDELEGKKLVEKVNGKIRIPMVIYSGSIAQIDDIEENMLLKKKLRTESLTDILKEIVTIYKTGITKLLRPSGIIDKKLTQIFWNHLVNDLNIWVEHNNAKTLTRYIFSHFQEYMEINSAGDFEEYHPAEIYILPPIKKNIHTGDIIHIKGEFYIVLTPACDLVFNYKYNEKGEKIPFRKAENLVVALAKNFDYNESCQNKKGDVDKSKITSYVTNDFYRYHYLPSFNGNSGFLIDFQQLMTIPLEEGNDRVASISGAFIKDIISRFSLYYSRQGQPTFFQKDIVNELYDKRTVKVDK